MTGLVRNGSSPWFALIYGADGSVFLTAKAVSYIPSSTLMKITFAPSGFIALPFETQVEEFYVGWTPHAMSPETERTIQIGGVVHPIPSLRRGNTWLQTGTEGITEIDAAIRPKNAFGFSMATNRAMLFPVLVQKEQAQ